MFRPTGGHFGGLPRVKRHVRVVELRFLEQVSITLAFLGYLGATFWGVLDVCGMSPAIWHGHAATLRGCIGRNDMLGRRTPFFGERLTHNCMLRSSGGRFRGMSVVGAIWGEPRGLQNISTSLECLGGHC